MELQFNWYTNILLTLLVLINIVFVIALYKIYEIYTQFKQFVTPIEPGKPSILGNTIQNLIDSFSKQVGSQVKTSLMGTISGVSRGIDALNNEVNQASLEAQSPALGSILELVPSLKKKLSKNPLLLNLAMSAISKAGKNHDNAPPSVANESYADRIKKYS